MSQDADDIDSLWSDYDVTPDYDEADVTCKFCGKKHLYWMQVQGPNGVRYALIDDETGQKHQCNPVSDDEFEDLT